MLTPEFADAFAREWVESWNSHDLDRIFAHYREDFEISSPLIVKRMGEASGTLRGKAAVRPYWSAGLAAAPELRFELERTLLGVDSLCVVYRRHDDRRVAEVFFFDEARQVYRTVALYDDPP